MAISIPDELTKVESWSGIKMGVIQNNFYDGGADIPNTRASDDVMTGSKWHYPNFKACMKFICFNTHVIKKKMFMHIAPAYW